MSAMVIEESRLWMMSGDNPVKLAYTTMTERVCYNCGEKGHMSYKCPLPRNFGGRSGTHGGHGGGHAGGCGKGRGTPQANAITMESSTIESGSET